MGKPLTDQQKAEREYKRVMARNRRARERENERVARKEQKERDLNEEYELSASAERYLHDIAVPTISCAAVTQILQRELQPTEFKEQPFQQGSFNAYPYSVENPSGPNAKVISARIKQAKEELERSAPLLPSKWRVGAIAVSFSMVVFFLLHNDFMKGWPLWITGLIALAGMGVMYVGTSSYFRGENKKQRAMLWRAILKTAEDDARHLYTTAENIRHDAWKNEESLRLGDWKQSEIQRRKEFEAEQLGKMNFAKGLLHGDVDCMRQMIDRISPVLDAVFVANLQNSETAHLAFLAPQDVIPTHRVRRTQKAVTYQEKSDNQIDAEYQRLTAALALRYAGDLFAGLPTLNVIEIDGYQIGVNPATGHTVHKCAISVAISRTRLCEINIADAEPEMVVRSFGGKTAWDKDMATSLTPATSVTIDQLEDAFKAHQENNTNDDINDDDE